MYEPGRQLGPAPARSPFSLHPATWEARLPTTRLCVERCFLPTRNHTRPGSDDDPIAPVKGGGGLTSRGRPGFQRTGGINGPV